MLLTGCNSTKSWDVWEIKCFNPEYKTWEYQRFEGGVYIPADTNVAYLRPKEGGKIINNNRMCTYKYLGRGGEINNG